MHRKTSSRGLGTVEALMSVMGDMQALVMELKNLVEQCLASERAVQVRGGGVENHSHLPDFTSFLSRTVAHSP